MSEEQTKRLRLMRIWLFGTFVIVAAAVAVYGGFFTGVFILQSTGYWLIVGITAVLCVAVYFGYQWWLRRT